MSDYISILLSAVEEDLYPFLGADYFLAIQREELAAGALEATLTAAQKDLFRAYENTRNDSESAYQDAFARRAFLLAREVYR